MNEALCGHLDGCPGMTLTRENADRAVGLVSNLPGVASASATLAPGATVGSSDYTLDAVPGAAVSGALGVDDYGNEYTGRIRETGDLHWNNPLGIGDLFTADVALSGLSGMDGGRGTMNGVVDYSLPIGYDGWRVGTNYTRLIYRLGHRSMRQMHTEAATSSTPTRPIRYLCTRTTICQFASATVSNG